MPCQSSMSDSEGETDDWATYSMPDAVKADVFTILIQNPDGSLDVEGEGW